MKKIILAVALTGMMFASTAGAMQDMDHSKEKAMTTKSEQSMEAMDHDNEEMDGTFSHMEMIDGIHAEFKVMDLASMNMKDPNGNTHHVMATFSRGEEKLAAIVGKVKLISPTGKAQTADLKDFGSGNYAANFKVDEDGKWGVICLFKDDKGTHTVKFWYPHMTM